jgi:MFS family permease
MPYNGSTLHLIGTQMTTNNMTAGSGDMSPKESFFGDKFGLMINVLSTLLTSTSMGMLAILVPVHLASFPANSDSAIGTALSFETIASLVICLLIPSILKHTKLALGIAGSSLFRLPTILLFPYFSELGMLIPIIFVHAVGCYYIFLMLQIWVNSIPFKKNKGLMIALYSTSISVGFAVGPILINVLNNHPMMFAELTNSILASTTAFVGHAPVVDTARLFVIAMLVCALSVVPLIVYLAKIPKAQFNDGSSIFKTIMENRGAMFSIAMAGVSQFGVAAFIVIYGMKNDLSFSDAALLLSCFMFGSLLLEVPIAWVSDYFDRRFFIVWCAFACILCAVYLPIAIYTPMQAWILVFIWGGVISGIYSVSLTLIGERYTSEDDLIASNAGYSLMESIGGTVGISAIGFSMHYLGTDGMPYIIMFASILYFSFALTRYPVE